MLGEEDMRHSIDPEKLLERIKKDAARLDRSTRDKAQVLSYLLSYSEFVQYFEKLRVIKRHHFVIGAHFTYGWMPTILELKTDRPDQLDRGAEMLQRAKSGDTLSGGEDGDLSLLKSLVNHSMVGVSKLLHFVNPSAYCIWDSQVYQYMHQVPRKKFYPYLQTPDNYLEYLSLCRQIVKDLDCQSVTTSVNRWIMQVLRERKLPGYKVSSLRAVELVMFMAGDSKGPT